MSVSISRHSSAAPESKLKQSSLSLNFEHIGSVLKKFQLILLTSRFENFWTLVISHVIQSENIGLRQKISSILIGDLIKLIVSNKLRFVLEVIREDPIMLWFGHFTPIPLVIAGG